MIVCSGFHQPFVAGNWKSSSPNATLMFNRHSARLSASTKILPLTDEKLFHHFLFCCSLAALLNYPAVCHLCFVLVDESHSASRFSFVERRNLRSPMCFAQTNTTPLERKTKILWARIGEKLSVHHERSRDFMLQNVWTACENGKYEAREKVGNSCVWFACQKALFLASHRVGDQIFAQQF